MVRVDCDFDRCLCVFWSWNRLRTYRAGMQGPTTSYRVGFGGMLYLTDSTVNDTEMDGTRSIAEAMLFSQIQICRASPLQSAWIDLDRIWWGLLLGDGMDWRFVGFESEASANRYGQVVMSNGLKQGPYSVERMPWRIPEARWFTMGAIQRR